MVFVLKQPALHSFRRRSPRRYTRQDRDYIRRSRAHCLLFSLSEQKTSACPHADSDRPECETGAEKMTPASIFSFRREIPIPISYIKENDPLATIPVVARFKRILNLMIRDVFEHDLNLHF